MAGFCCLVQFIKTSWVNKPLTGNVILLIALSILPSPKLQTALFCLEHPQYI